MAIFSANLEDLRELYINQLRHMYSVEKQLTEALPKMADAATDTQLKQAFTSHLQETRQHVSRVESLLERASEKVDDIKSKGIAALITEGEEVMKDAADSSVRDAGLILAGQRAEHYEIASYGALRQYAQLLGDEEAAQLIDAILQDEGHADHLLTEISNTANTRAYKAA